MNQNHVKDSRLKKSADWEHLPCGPAGREVLLCTRGKVPFINHAPNSARKFIHSQNFTILREHGLNLLARWVFVLLCNAKKKSESAPVNPSSWLWGLIRVHPGCRTKRLLFAPRSPCSPAEWGQPGSLGREPQRGEPPVRPFHAARAHEVLDVHGHPNQHHWLLLPPPGRSRSHETGLAEPLLTFSYFLFCVSQ